MSQHALAIAGALTLTLTIGMASSAAASKADYQQAYKAAVARHEKAQQLKHGWTTTDKTLAAAQKAAQSNDFNHAAKLAKRAQTLAGLAIEQAHDQKKHWRDAVVK